MLHVVAGLLRRDDTVLLCRRAPGRDYAGCWEFPGGKVEEGETPDQALKREWMEELALAIVPGAHVHSAVLREHGVRVELYEVQSSQWNLVDVDAGDGSHDAAKYMTLSEAAALNRVTPSTPIFLRYLYQLATVEHFPGLYFVGFLRSGLTLSLAPVYWVAENKMVRGHQLQMFGLYALWEQGAPKFLTYCAGGARRGRLKEAQACEQEILNRWSTGGSILLHEPGDAVRHTRADLLNEEK